MADTTFTQTIAPIDLIELTERQAEIMMIALDIGAYPDQEALLHAGFADATAKVDVWKAEMQRRANGPWVDFNQSCAEIRAELEELRADIEKT